MAYLIVVAGCLSLALGSCIGLLADIFNHANAVLVTVLTDGLRQLSRLPFGSLDVPAPPVWAVCAWYGVLFAWVAFKKPADDTGHPAPALFQ